MNKKKAKQKVEWDNPEQSARFIEMAQNLDTYDDAEERFKEAMRRVAAFKPKRKEKENR